MKAMAGSVFAAWLSSTGSAVAPAGRAGPQSQDRNSGEETDAGRLSSSILVAGGAGLAGALLASGAARAQQPSANLGTPASVVTNPSRDWSSHNPSIYPDPDVVVVDPSFIPLRRYQGAIYRVWTGALWAEGPAWSSQGRYVVFSDVSGNVQYRYIWDDGRVTAFRRPSYNSNGNSFDF